jgi:DNA replication protein DnaC
MTNSRNRKTPPTSSTPDPAQLIEQLTHLGLKGATESISQALQTTNQSDEVLKALQTIADVESRLRTERSLERRRRRAQLGSFKPLDEFQWQHLRGLDRQAMERILRLDFIDSADNVIFIGSHGLGKTTLLKNIGQIAVTTGHTVCTTTAHKMLGDLAAIDSPSRLRRAIGQLAGFDLLAIDEVGYLSYNDRAADLMYEIVSRRYDAGRSILISTNLSFAKWTEVFPRASCTAAIIERLVHRSEIIQFHGKSYRVAEAIARHQSIPSDLAAEQES